MEESIQVAGEIVFFKGVVFVEIVLVEEVVVAEVTESGGVDKFVDAGFCGGVCGGVHCGGLCVVCCYILYCSRNVAFVK